MDRKAVIKHLHVMEAYANGADVQIQDPQNNTWSNVDSPSFAGYREYRVKPTKPRIVEMILSPSNSYRAIELTNEVKDALEAAGIPYADK